MIRIIVLSAMDMAKALGGRRIEIDLPDNTDIQGLLLALCDKAGDDLRVQLYQNNEFRQSAVMMLLNGSNVFAYQGLRHPLKNNDEVLVMPLITGG